MINWVKRIITIFWFRDYGKECLKCLACIEIPGYNDTVNYRCSIYGAKRGQGKYCKMALLPNWRIRKIIQKVDRELADYYEKLCRGE